MKYILFIIIVKDEVSAGVYFPAKMTTTKRKTAKFNACLIFLVIPTKKALC